MSIHNNNLRAAIIASGKTYADLENETGISRSTIQRYATGKTFKIPFDRIKLLSDVLDVPLNYLIGWDDDPIDYEDIVNESGDRIPDDFFPDIYDSQERCKKWYEFKQAEALDHAREYGMIIPSSKEERLLKKYRSLDTYGKQVIDLILECEFKRVNEQVELTVKEDELLYDETYPKTEYLTSLSAGTGLFVFDDIPTKITQVVEKYKDADFVIGVSGNSMEPTYHDGDKVAVKKQSTIEDGEIGVFMINGDGYIKEFNHNVLISHNKKYPIITVSKNTICIGKVLGKI